MSGYATMVLWLEWRKWFICISTFRPWKNSKILRDLVLNIKFHYYIHILRWINVIREVRSKESLHIKCYRVFIVLWKKWNGILKVVHVGMDVHTSKQRDEMCLHWSLWMWSVCGCMKISLNIRFNNLFGP